MLFTTALLKINKVCNLETYFTVANDQLIAFLLLTRQHSSRIHTTHLPSIHVSVATTRSQHIDPQLNKFEQISRDDHQLSVAGEK